MHNKEIKNFNLDINRKFFIKFGYLKIDNFLNKKNITKIKKIIDNSVKDKKTFQYYEYDILNKRKQLTRIENFLKVDKELDNYLTKELPILLHELLGGNWKLFKEKINFKPPLSKKDKLHQDVQAGWLKYSKNFVSVLISIGSSNSKNANLQLDISGNNHQALRGKEFRPLNTKLLKNPKFKDFTLHPGDALFFNGFLPHKSGINRTKKSRVQMYCTYTVSKLKNIRDKYYEDKLSKFPPNNLRKKNIHYKYLI